jgi:hypothetical protein
MKFASTLFSFTFPLLIVACGSVQTTSQVSQDETQDVQRIVEFHIKAGTANNSWNTRDTIVTVHIGDTLRIINDDVIQHRLHTNGAPCPHGPNFAPGTSFDCAITKAFDPGEANPLYDHNVGSKAEFWLKAE